MSEKRLFNHFSEHSVLKGGCSWRFRGVFERVRVLFVVEE